MKKQEVVLVTGCSSGIGRDLCEIMSKNGYLVVATARNIKSLDSVSASLKLALDVTDKESINRAVKQIMERYHRIDMLINNAGYSIRGVIEEVPVSEVKKIFDVNVFGIMQVTQAVLPYMREQKSGKVIHIGSISGKFAQAANGSYCASKHAVEAINDALRLEVAQFHIQSTVIEPGAMQTNFFHILSKTSDELLTNSDSPYSHIQLADVEYRKKQKRMESEKAANKICKIIRKDKLKARYQVAVPIPLRILIHLSDSLKEFILLHH